MKRITGMVNIHSSRKELWPCSRQPRLSIARPVSLNMKPIEYASADIPLQGSTPRSFIDGRQLSVALSMLQCSNKP